MSASEKSRPSTRGSTRVAETDTPRKSIPSEIDAEANLGGGDQPGEDMPEELSSTTMIKQVIMGDLIDDATVIGDAISDVLRETEQEIDHRERIAEVKEIISDVLLDAFEEVEQREREMKWPSLAKDKQRAIAFLKRTSTPEGISLSIATQHRDEYEKLQSQKTNFRLGMCDAGHITSSYRLDDLHLCSALVEVRMTVGFVVHGPRGYDHLATIINKVLAEKPSNVLEYFEDYSRIIKEERFRPQDDYLRDVYVPPEQAELASKKQKLFKALMIKEEVGEQEDVVKSEDEEIIGPNLLNQLHYFEQAGVALPRKEVFLIQLAMLRLARTNTTISSYRFWGKILGLQKNYIIVEATQKKEEYQRRIQEIEEQKHFQAIEEKTEARISAAEIQPVPPPSPEPELRGGESVSTLGPPPIPRKPLPPVPQSTYQPPPEVPTENPGDGVNAKVYYVCNAPEDDWTMLPDVTPQQLAVARKIRRYFTGNLDTKVETFPPFPGNEANYLRAQIARISAGTQVSPRGYFFSGELGGEGGEEEEEGEAGGAKTLKVNPFYTPVPIKDLVDGSLAFWVHHTQHILKQGRTAWWNPTIGTQDEIKGEEEGEEEEEEAREHAEPEIGPALLTPLSEDVTTENIRSWTVRQTSILTPGFAAATIRSNLWPGAYAVAAGKMVENLYLGWGQKYVSANYTPPALDPIQSEYPLGPEIMEMQDPTVEDEEAWRIAHTPKPVPFMGEGGEGGEAGEEEEEEDE